MIYRPALSYVHDQGYRAHPENAAPGVLRRLEPVLDAGHRVVATDASTAMLDLARRQLPEGADLRRLTLPDDDVPPADAIVGVGVGHALNYLPDAEAVDRAWVALAAALRPGGILVVDLCDLEWGRARRTAPGPVRPRDDRLRAGPGRPGHLAP